MLECGFCYDLGRSSHLVSKRTLSRHTQAWLHRHEYNHNRSLPTPGQLIVASNRNDDSISEQSISELEGPESPQIQHDLSPPEGDEVGFGEYIPTYSVSRSNTGNIVDDLNTSDGSFFEVCEWVDTGISRQQYEQLRAFIKRRHSIELPCVRRRDDRLQKLTQLWPRLIDCCRKSCMAYTGQYDSLQACKYCGEPRYRSPGKPFQCFLYVPLGQRLLRQYRMHRRAHTLQTYCRPFFERPIDYFPSELTDWWDGRRYRELRRDGLFTQYTDIALQLLLDGVQVIESSNHSCTPVISINYNLPPAIRNQKHNILLNLLIPGPKKYKDLDSYLQPLVEELEELGRGVGAYNAYRNEEFVLRAWPVVVTGMLSIRYCCCWSLLLLLVCCRPACKESNLYRGRTGHF